MAAEAKKLKHESKTGKMSTDVYRDGQFLRTNWRKRQWKKCETAKADILNSLFWTKYSRMDQLKFFKDCLPQILLGQFLNALSHLA